MGMTFPGAEWEWKDPQELGFSAEKLEQFGTWFAEEAGDSSYRLAIARSGYLVAEWGQGFAIDKQINQSSAGKSFYSCLRGSRSRGQARLGLPGTRSGRFPEPRHLGSIRRR